MHIKDIENQVDNPEANDFKKILDQINQNSSKKLK